MGDIIFNGIRYGSVVDQDYGFTDLIGTLTAGQTTLTIQNDLITKNRTIEIFTDTFGVNPTNAVVTNGQIVLTFLARSNDVGVKVRVSKTSANVGGLNADEFAIISTTYTTT